MSLVWTLMSLDHLALLSVFGKQQIDSHVCYFNKLAETRRTCMDLLRGFFKRPRFPRTDSGVPSGRMVS